LVIVQLSGGLGNQLYEYSFGKKLALRLNTELKLAMKSSMGFLKENRSHTKYMLDNFNIQAQLATPEEIKHVRENGIIPTTLSEFENTQCKDVFIQGIWMFTHSYYRNIRDVLRKELTFNKVLSATAEKYKNKILSAECSVSMHFRRGDYIYSPERSSTTSWGYTVPFSYYYTCIDILKHKYPNLTVFVFSDTPQSIKEDIHLDVPVEFIEGCENDTEDLFLMSLCNHNIVANSTFSQWAAWFNSYPEKKVFYPMKSTNEEVQKYLASLTPAQKNDILSKGGGRVPFEYVNKLEVSMPPFFSLLLVMNNDAATIAETLDSLLNLDYKYYEVIIIDNASTDGSGEICQQKIADKKNVTYRRLHSKVKNAEAWNIANSIWAEGKYVLFLKGDDRFLSKALRSVYGINEYAVANIVNLISWLEEDKNGTVTADDKKFSKKQDVSLAGKVGWSKIGTNGLENSKLLLEQQINNFLATKFYNREFLQEHKIKFDKNLDDAEAELFLQVEAFFKSKYFMHLLDPLYIAPNKLNVSGGGYLANLLNIRHASIAITASESLDLRVA